MAGNPGAPPLGQPSLNADQIHAAYQQAFGRDATGSELASELENANKYSAQGILNTIAARTNNQPGSGQPGTATWNGPIAGGNQNTAPMSSLVSPQYAAMPHIAQMSIAPPAMMPSPTFQPAPTAAPQAMPNGYAGDPNGGLNALLMRYRRPNGSY